MRRLRAPAVVGLLLLVLAGCASPARSGPAPPTAPGELRVMTWNVETARYDPPDWAGTIAAARPDVVALQEICAGEAVALADLLRREHGLSYVAVPGPVRPVPVEDADPVNAELRRPCHDGPTVTYGLAVLTRLPVTSASTVLYAPDHRDEQRGYQRVTVRGPDGGPLTVYDTHLGLAGVAAAQIGALAQRAGDEPGPTVVLGDLNVGRDQQALLAPLRARFAEVDPDRRLPTFPNDPADPGRAPTDRIDDVFSRGLAPGGPPTVPWAPASDHRPLVAGLAVRAAPGGGS